MTVDKLQWSKDNPYICLLPYTSRQFFFDKNTVSPCCNLKRTQNNNPYIHINELKDSVEQNKHYAPCQECYNCENNGKLSERQRHLLELDDDTFNRLLTDKTSDTFSIHCTLSNVCNMACRSCDAEHSSLYSKISTGKETPGHTLSKYNHFWKSLLNTINDAVDQHNKVFLVISGGEGFVQPDFFKLIDWLIDQGINNSVCLTVNTNGSVFNQELYDKLCTSFAQLDLAVSIDSIYENYHYVRWPGTWAKIESNLIKFAEYKKKFTNFNFFLTPVWSINNIFYLKDWVEYFSKFDNGNISAYDTPLWQPSWLDVRYLPQYLKEELVKDLEQVVSNSWLQNNKSFHANILNLIEQCSENFDNQEIEWKKYIQNTKVWDNKTKTKLAIHCEKLYNKLNENDVRFV